MADLLVKAARLLHMRDPHGSAIEWDSLPAEWIERYAEDAKAILQLAFQAPVTERMRKIPKQVEALNVDQLNEMIFTEMCKVRLAEEHIAEWPDGYFFRAASPKGLSPNPKSDPEGQQT